MQVETPTPEMQIKVIKNIVRCWIYIPHKTASAFITFKWTIVLHVQNLSNHSEWCWFS